MPDWYIGKNKNCHFSDFSFPITINQLHLVRQFEKSDTLYYIKKIDTIDWNDFLQNDV